MEQRITEPAEQDLLHSMAAPPASEGGEEALMERLRAILDGAVHTLRLGSASIHILNEAGDELTSRISVESGGNLAEDDGVHRVERGGAVDDVISGRTASFVHRVDAAAGEFNPDAAVPLTIKDRVIGLLSATNQGGGTQAADSLAALGVFATHAAYVIDASRAQERLEIEGRHERTLFEVSRAISSALNPNQVLETVAHLMAIGVQSERSAVYVWEMDLNQLRRRADYGTSPETGQKYSAIPFPADDPIARELSRNQPVHLRQSGRPTARTFADAVEEKEGIAIPLISKGRLIAVAVIGCPGGAAEFDEDEVNLLMAIASQAAVSIENATLYEAQHRAVTELAALYAVSQALAATPTLDQRLQVVAHSLTAVAGVSRCGIFLIEEGRAKGQLIIGVSEAQEEEFRKLRLDLSERETAMMRAIKEGRPTVVEGAAGLKDAYVASRWEVRRMLAVPLIFEGRTMGLAAVDEPGAGATFSSNAIKVAAAIGEQAAIAIQNARLFEQTRQHAEDLGVLWEAGQALGGELATDEILDTIIQQVKRLPMAAAASVMVKHWDGSLLVARGIGIRSRYRNEKHLTDPCDVACIPALHHSDEPLAHTAHIHEGCSYAELQDLDSKDVSILSIPLVQRGEVLGAINVMTAEAHAFTTGEIRLVGSLASLAAAALARAQLYERERRIAETFQRSFLPEIEERIDDYEIAHQYSAALDEARVGGDFYDVFCVGEDKLVLVIGDVSGKGLNAAVHTAMAKYLLRGYAFEEQDAGKILSRVNDALCYYVPASLFVTLFCGILDRKTHVVQYANAGHELPLHWADAAGRFETLSCTGRALGFLPNCRYVSESVTIDPGDSLLLYTDGITEARSEEGFFDISGVRDAVQPVVKGDAPRMAEAIESAVRQHAGGKLKDDLALLVLKRRSEG